MHRSDNRSKLQKTMEANIATWRTLAIGCKAKVVAKGHPHEGRIGKITEFQGVYVPRPDGSILAHVKLCDGKASNGNFIFVSCASLERV